MLSHTGCDVDEEVPEGALLDLIRTGNTEAWEIFVYRYERLVCSAARGNGLSTDDSMDVGEKHPFRSFGVVE